MARACDSRILLPSFCKRSERMGHPSVASIGLGHRAYRLARATAFRSVVVSGGLLITAAHMHLVALVNNTQPFEREQVIDLANIFGPFAHERRQPAGSDDGNVLAQIGNESLQNSIDQPEVAVVKARLKTVDGIGREHARGLSDIYARQARSVLKKRVG